MDTEIAEESTYKEESKLEMKDNSLHSDCGEEDGDAKMTLAVTSDEDSRDSGKNKNNMEKDILHKIEERIMDKMSMKDEIVSPISSASGSSSKRKSSTGSAAGVRKISLDSNKPVNKRKLSQVDWSTDEEDLVGFDEDGQAIGINRHKKIKETPEKEPTEAKEPEKEIENVKKIDEEMKIIKQEGIPVKDEKTEKVENEENKLPTEEIPESPKVSPKQQPDMDKLQSTPVSKGKSLKDPIFRKPFSMGWKREFVYRAIPGVSNQKGEVYYINPLGKKLRTRIEVGQHLTPGLSLDNFTFIKEPLGFEEEVIRSAKPKCWSTPSTPVEINREQPLGKRIPKPKGPKGASPPPQGWTATKVNKFTYLYT